jgi:D-alanine transaminase
VRETGITFDERAFTVEEAKKAREAFYTAASAWVMPVISVDGARIGDGKPGDITKRLRKLYLERARDEAI